MKTTSKCIFPLIHRVVRAPMFFSVFPFFHRCFLCARHVFWLVRAGESTARVLSIFHNALCVRRTHASTSQCIGFEYFAHFFFVVAVFLLNAYQQQWRMQSLWIERIHTIFFFVVGKAEAEHIQIMWHASVGTCRIGTNEQQQNRMIFSSSLLFGELSKLLTASHSNH